MNLICFVNCRIYGTQDSAWHKQVLDKYLLSECIKEQSSLYWAPVCITGLSGPHLLPYIFFASVIVNYLLVPQTPACVRVSVPILIGLALILLCIIQALMSYPHRYHEQFTSDFLVCWLS